MLLLVILNLILEKCGVDIIKTDESTILNIVEYLIEVAIIVVGFWYNNSFSEKALNAQEFLENLRKEEIYV